MSEDIRESKVPGVLDLGHFMPEIRRLTSSSFDSIDELSYKKKDRLTRLAIRGRVDLDAEAELRELIAREEREVVQSKTQGLSGNEIVDKRIKSPTSKRIKELLRSFGIAKLNTAGDWIVNRKSEIPESLGVVPFNELMELIGNFKWIYGKDDNPKLIALDLGCGNGEFCELLRRDTKNGSTQDWEIYGYADCIYFTLKDFLFNLVRDEFQDDEILKEFLEVVSILLIREIHNIEAFSGKKTYEQDVLQQLPINLGAIRQIFHNLGDYIKIEGKDRIRVDLEFLSDAQRDISEDCKELISVFLKEPGHFIRFYMKEELQDISPEEKNRLRGIQGEIKSIEHSFGRMTRGMTRRIRKVSNTERLSNQEAIEAEMRKEAKRSTLVENRKKMEVLKQEKARILAKIPDLSPFISLYHYNVIPGRFDEIESAIPENAVDFMWSFRSTSHLGDAEYFITLKDAAKRLAPGGIFLDDGKRESWTRYERMKELTELREDLGADFSVRLIVQNDRPSAVLIERALETDSKKRVFFSDKFGEEMLNSTGHLVDIHEWADKMPIVFVRNEVIKSVREALIDGTYEGLGGRMFFKGVHPIIDRSIYLLEREVQIDKTELVQIAKNVRNRVLSILLDEGPPIVKRLIRERARPTRDSRVSTLTRTQRIELPQQVNQSRSFEIEDLPRNGDVPSLETLGMRTFELVSGLIMLQGLIDRPPVTVCEFDDCFTNQLMVDLLHKVFDEACLTLGIDFKDLVNVYNIKLAGERYAEHESLGVVNIIGGSTGDVYDEYGKRFTNNYVRPLLDEIAKGARARFLGVCFGSQSILQAFGDQQGKRFRTVPGALQYGAFPVSFSDEGYNGNASKRILKELTGRNYTVSMTRGSYSIVEDYEDLREQGLIEPLAYEFSKTGGRMRVDKYLPPVAFSLFGGKVITSQFHPEIPLKNPNSLTDMNSWLERNHQYLKDEFGEEGTRLPQHFDLKALSERGVINWVKNDVGPLFLLNVLSQQVNSLLQELKLR